jgi:SpoIIAA-like
MPAKIQYDNDICVLRISGTLKRSEFGEGQDALSLQIDSGEQPRVLAILENFTGWERNADWNDLDFQLTRGKEIARIAIVGDLQWEAHALAFAGAGFRRAPVKFFPTSQLQEARAWLSE